MTDLTAPSGTAGGAELPRATFLDLDPAAAAAQADLGVNGALQVANVQDFYRQLFEYVGDTAWPDSPEGPLATQWRGIGGAQSTYYLMNVASMVYELMRSCSPGLDGTIIQRLRTVLRPPSKEAYVEALVELEVGGMLATPFHPVQLEPLVPLEMRSKPHQPMSPDYGVRVPETSVTVEVTVWHWEAYAAWHRLYDEVYRVLSKRMSDRGIQRSVHIEMPLESPKETVKWLWSAEFLSLLAAQEYGEIETAPGAAPRPIRVAWHPALHFPDMESIDSDLLAAHGNPPFTVGDGIGHSMSMSVNPCIDTRDTESALASLRRSIDRKKRQRDPALPHLLAISPTFSRMRTGPDQQALTWDVFGPLIAERLWPNDRYAWLTGLLQYTPIRVRPPAEGASFLGFNPNPNAAFPAPESLVRAMTGQDSFHLMWQRPRREQRDPARHPIGSGAQDGEDIAATPPE